MSDNKIEIDGRVANFDVFNALNLHNPLLGEAYANFNWNPLGDDFRLDISFIEKYLENARYDKLKKAPSFLDRDPKAVMQAFRVAEKNNQELLDELKERFESGEFVNYKKTNIEKQVKDIIFMLECRQKMFQISLGQLKAKGIDPLKAYENISGINKKLASLLDEAYYEQLKKRDALRRMLAQAEFDADNDWDLFDEIDMFDEYGEEQEQGNEAKHQGPVEAFKEGFNSVSNTGDKLAEQMANTFYNNMHSDYAPNQTSSKYSVLQNLSQPGPSKDFDPTPLHDFNPTFGNGFNK